MNLKAKLILSAVGVCALPLAQAQAGDFEDFGRVVRVQPRIEQVRTPRQECRTDYVQAPVQQQVAFVKMRGGHLRIQLQCLLDGHFGFIIGPVSEHGFTPQPLRQRVSGLLTNPLLARGITTGCGMLASPPRRQRAFATARTSRPRRSSASPSRSPSQATGC